MGNQKGAAINETVQAMKFNEHLRKLAEQRERKTKKKRKEACTGGAVQTSKGLCPNKTYDNYTAEKEKCQDGTSRNPPSGEIWQQNRQSELPVHLL